MIQIRKGVFETNSSSSHSIVITKEDKPLDEMFEPKYMPKDGKLWLWGHELEFGRAPFAILNDWEGRLRYAIASKHDSMMDEIEALCYKRIIGFKGFKFDKSTWDDGFNYGYVDHQSYGLLDSLLQKTTLEDFIFNDRYIVIIDGDEYNVFIDLMDTPMFTSEHIEKILPSCSWDFEENFKENDDIKGILK